jgi:hypothetical protein
LKFAGNLGELFSKLPKIFPDFFPDAFTEFHDLAGM